jgi:transcriptional regulator with XRE-family HTH domain
MTFGERIITIRKKLKWSQDELAKKVGTSAPIIGRYERNEIKPAIDTAKNIADALGVTVDYLLGGSDTLVLDKKIMQRIEDIEKLDTNTKTKIFDIIDTYLRDFKTRQAYSA